MCMSFVTICLQILACCHLLNNKVYVSNKQFQNRDHGLQKRFLDGVCTVGFGLIAVCSFYGIWEVEEVYFQHRQGFNDTAIKELRGKNSWDCVVY